MAVTAGVALVKLLQNYGVDTVFGIPGVHTLELYRGLPETDIRHVLTRHEQGAGFMADGYARVTGKPGVCFLITGPGLTNAATAIGQAYSDSVPMLVITSVNETHTLGKGRGRLHETKDQRAITAPLTAFSATARTPEDLPDLIARAFAVFNSQRRRPVHIEVPMDVLAAPVARDWSGEVALSARRPAPCADDIERAAALLAAAKRPLIIAGGGAVNAASELQALAEAAQVPLFTTVAGKGILPAAHPLSGGATLCTPAGWELVEQADLVLAIGTELADTDMWRDTLPITGDIVRIDIDSDKMNDLYPAALPIVADSHQAVSLLLAAWGDRAPVTHSDWLARLQQLPAQVQHGHAALQQQHQQVLDCIAEVLPEDALVATDMTQIAYTGNYVFPRNRPRQWLHPTGYGTLGYGLPAGIGAKIAAPAQPALVIAGDGGFLYTVQELATAVEEVDTALVVLIYNNASLGQIRDDMLERNIEPVGVLPRNPDFIGLARAFGCQVYQPGSLQGLAGDLQQAFAFSGVSFIEVDAERLFI
ncbi:5-guanidino-2-oxopentanoate decarboxylase [Microbulbifer hydrolyticus]|uniref:5-guanidino-2-oxopentanoate decarboxylase n=1 Tax=Microbulbifer hydrolyticus TaxID=48074 RepID=A0A6P1TCL0_9GAMM|nr:5-guanidino-2-oxopentanoate decarboxylase [Microbulbifer hydrolyticus]MBB5210104.1 5-guanidino-2-oxopentanoate decarboxylase [Microbulbifer hydrolyticus]QHQ39376.1 5-guanidino-2-oxopentanoate decarboxylase [Microbulbifer hydrolyticus]